MQLGNAGSPSLIPLLTPAPKWRARPISQVQRHWEQPPPRISHSPEDSVCWILVTQFQ